MSVPAIDFQMHNSLFLVAHFHNVIIGGVVFGYFAGWIYWFPKIFGFRLNEKLGKISFWFWLFGFYFAFMPLYVLGLMGMTRRLNHYSEATGWHPWLIVAAFGTFLVLIGVIFQWIQLYVSIKNRNKPEYRVGADAWEDGRTLEWSIPSPVPFYNFAVTPKVDTLDAHWENKMKLERGEKVTKPKISDIHMPKNTGVGFITAVFSGVFGFGAIWHIDWMIFLGIAGMIITPVVRTFQKDIDYYVPAKEVKDIEASYKTGAA